MFDFVEILIFLASCILFLLCFSIYFSIDFRYLGSFVEAKFVKLNNRILLKTEQVAKNITMNLHLVVGFEKQLTREGKNMFSIESYFAFCSSRTRF